MMQIGAVVEPTVMAVAWPLLWKVVQEGAIADVMVRLSSWTRADLTALRDEVKSYHDCVYEGIRKAAEEREITRHSPELVTLAVCEALTGVQTFCSYLEACVDLSITRLGGAA